MNASVIGLAESYLKDFPNSQGAWSLYSLALSNLSRGKEAKKALLKTMRLHKDSNDFHGWLLCRMGNIYKDSGNFSKAIEWYKKAHNAIPEEATFLIHIGVTFLRIEKYDEAAATLIQATKCSEGCIDEAFYNLGVVRMAQKKYKEASVCFERAIKVDSKYKEAKQALKDVRKVLEIKTRLC
jgi:tetratricopeptide (TPR) repeat protein